MTTFIFLVSFISLWGETQSETWYGLEPYAPKPLVSSFAGIHEDTLYLVGGPENSVTTLDITNIYMNDYDGLLYQPDLNVIHGKWTTKRYWYNFNYGLFCTQSCSTQIGERLYIVAPFKNVSGIITQTATLFVYDLDEYKFLSTTGYNRRVPRDVQYACVIHNNTHLFIIGGGNYSDRMTLYSIVHDAWIEMNSTLTIGRTNFGCAFNANSSQIFAFGGDIAPNSHTSTIEQYDIAQDEWSLLMSYDTGPPTTAPTMKPTMNSSSIRTTPPTAEWHTTQPTPLPTTRPATLVTLTFKRSKHQCVLDVNTNAIYIFGGGGCSQVDNICSNYRTLVEIFDVATSTIRTDEALLLSAISDSYSALQWSYSATRDSNQAGSWFDGIFVIGGHAETYNATYKVQYRIADYKIINIERISWYPDPITFVLFVTCGACGLILCAGFIFKMVRQYTDTRLVSVFFWFLYLMDVVFDCAFNEHLWSRDKYALAAVSLCFILCRLVYSVAWQLRLGLKQWTNDIAIRERVNQHLSQYMSPCNYERNGWGIYVCAVLSGSSHGLIHLLNSNLFGLSVFNMGLTKRHLIHYNLSRLPSGLACGNVPQLIIQVLYLLEWGSAHPTQETKVLYAILTTFTSLCFGIRDIWIYRHSQVPLRTLMLEEEFTKPYFLIFTSQEMYEIGHQLIHKGDEIADAISQMIAVEPDTVEINLCQRVPQGIKVSFVEYSGTKDASYIVHELTSSIEDGWFQTAIKTHWKLSGKPSIEIWDVQTLEEDKQLFMMDYKALTKRTKCWKLICVCGCCDRCGDMLRASSMRK